MAGEADYKGSHSITFSDGTRVSEGRRKHYLLGKNTWEDWRLIPVSKPLVAPPGIRTSYQEIPGRNGFIDMTAYHIGDAVSGMRTGNWEFILDNGWTYGWEEFRKSIIRYLHGKEFYVALEDVPTWYYIGRISFDEFKSESWNNKVVLKYELQSDRHSIYGDYINKDVPMEDDWLWDPFNFETDSVPIISPI